MKDLLLAIIFGLFASTASAVPSSSYQQSNVERIYEENDHAFTAAKPLPDSILHVLLSTILSPRDAKDLLAKTPHPGQPGTLFEAIPIHLKSNDDNWLLVVGTAAPTTGGDNGHFWVVDLSGPTPRASYLAPANAIEILHTTNYGYHDLVSDWCSPNECEFKTFRFRHGRYREISKRWTSASR